MRLVIVDQSFEGVGGHHAEYTLCIAKEAAKYAQVTVLANHRCEVQSSQGIEIRPTFQLPWTRAQRARPPALYDPTVSFPAWSFLADLRLGLGRIDISPEDHVFVHSIGFTEVEDLLTFALTCDHSRLPIFDILLRRDLDEISGDQQVFQRFVAYVKAFAGLGFVPGHARFFTDTDELSEHYTTVTGIPFATLAIPFDQEAMQTALAARPPRTADEPLIVGYLGDARPEKGYQFFPNVAARLTHSHLLSGKVRLRLQSNFNLPGGETPAIPEARRALERFGPAVELLYDPLDQDEYYRQLAEMDIIVLPYLSGRYHRRSSGIFVQAAAAGKVVVVPRVTTMWAAARHYGMENCIFYDTPEELPDAVVRAIDRYDVLKTAATSYRDRWCATNSPAALVATILGGSAGADSAGVTTPEGAGPLVLHVIDGHSTHFQTGTAVNQYAQSRFLQEAGYRVASVFLVRTFPSDEDLAAWIERNYRYWFTTKSVFSWLVYFARAPNEQRARSLEYELANSELLSVPETLRSLVTSGAVDVIWTNYVTTVPFLRSLGALHRVPILCEAHDIQSFQFAIQNERAVDEDELALELSLFADCDMVNSVSGSESLLLASTLGPSRVTTLTPPIFGAPLALEDIAGAQGLGELVSSAGSNLPFVDFEQAHRSGATWQFEALREVAGLDLLFISSVHTPNMLSLDWFLQSVYGPYLAPAGVTLLLAGALSETEWASERQRRFPGTFFLAGQVDNLRPLYAAAKVVILPITQGAGVNIKTLEALSFGKPIVATSLALRGVSGTREFLRSFDDADGFSGRILELLGDPSLRRREASRNWHLAAAQRDIEGYFGTLSGVFGLLLGHRPDVHYVGEHARDFEFVEWDKEIPMLNRLARMLMEGLPQSRAVAREIEALLGKSETRDKFSRILSALVYRCSAPVLKTLTYLNSYIRENGSEPAGSELDTISAMYCHALFSRALIKPSLRLVAGCKVLSEVLRCAGVSKVNEIVDSIGSIDIVILAQDAEGSSPRVFIESVMKFLEECYAKHLISQGVSLVIVGNFGIDIQVPGVVLATNVSDPGPILAAGRVVVAPWSELAVLHPSAFDSMIQTITACKPLVATQPALWFIDEIDRAELAVTSAEECATRVIDLLADSGARLAAAARTRSLAERLFGDLPSWQEWTNSVEGATQYLIMNDTRFAEWGPWLAACGNLIQKIANAAPLTAAEAINFAQDLGDAAACDAWREVVGAIFGRGDACILRDEFGPVLTLPSDMTRQIRTLEDFIFAVKKSAFALLQRDLQLGHFDDPLERLGLSQLQAASEETAPRDPRSILLGASDEAIEMGVSAPMPGFGWYASEESESGRHRWTGPEPRFTLELFLPERAYSCSMELIPSRRENFNNFSIELNGTVIPYQSTQTGGKITIVFSIPARKIPNRSQLAVFCFQHDAVFRPADQGVGDKRLLGFAVCSIRFERQEAAHDGNADIISGDRNEPEPEAVPATRDTGKPTHPAEARGPGKRLRADGEAPDPDAVPAVNRRALIIDDSVPEPDKDAGSNAVLQHILSLQRLGYQVSFIPADNMARIDPYTADLEQRGVECFYRPRYTSVGDVLVKHPAPFGLVYLHRHANASKYGGAIRAHSPTARVLYCVADLHFLRLLRQAELEDNPALRDEAERMRDAELALLSDADCTIVHSSAEAELLRQMSPHSNVHVIPWTVELRNVRKSTVKRPELAFIGGYRHPPNVDAAKWAVQSIMPLLREQVAKVELLLVGSHMPEEVAALAANDVVAVGYVPSLDDIFGRIRLTIAPLRYGAGLKGKVLDSMAAGIPCVMTTIAAEGLNLPAELQSLVADEPSGFSERLATLCRDERQYRRIVKAAQAYVGANYSSERIDSLIRQACGLQ